MLSNHYTVPIYSCTVRCDVLGSMEVSVFVERVGLLAKLTERAGADEHDKDVALAWINEMVNEFVAGEVNALEGE